MRLVLASSSPRRRAILSNLRLRFDVRASKSELDWLGEEPSEFSVKSALHKARDVRSEVELADAIIIGADTIVVVDGKVIGKPKDKNDALDMLLMLSGRTHSVITGLALLSADREETAFVETKVHFRKASKRALKRYVASCEPLDKAGGYAIQGLAAPLIDHIDGDYYNVVGLPVAKLFEMLEDFGFELYSWL